MANKYSHLSRQSEAKRDLYKRIHRKGFLVCAKKRAFRNALAAESFLDRNGYDGRPYQCQHCHMWHNTTKGKK